VQQPEKNDLCYKGVKIGTARTVETAEGADDARTNLVHAAKANVTQWRERLIIYSKCRPGKMYKESGEAALLLYCRFKKASVCSSLVPFYSRAIFILVHAACNLGGGIKVGKKKGLEPRKHTHSYCDIDC